VFDFLSASVFQLTNTERNNLWRFILAFDTNLAPVVGQQVTLSSTVSDATAQARVTLLETQAAAGDCDLVVKTVINGEDRGGFRLPDGTFQLDREAEPTMTDAALRASALVAPVTFTAVPPGSGRRIGVDRDDDGAFDHDEIDLGTDPADPLSFPVPTTGIRASSLTLRDDVTPPIDPLKSTLSFRSAKVGVSPSGVVVPAPGSAADPTPAGANGGGASLTVYRTGGGTDKVVLPLAAARWTKTGSAARPGYRYTDTHRVAGPITSVVLSNGTLSIRGSGAGMYQLDNAPQGGMALRLQVAGVLEFCAAAPAKSPTTTYDTLARFTGVQNSPAPAVCPAVP
jgi:hypothetical protein